MSSEGKRAENLRLPSLPFAKERVYKNPSPPTHNRQRPIEPKPRIVMRQAAFGARRVDLAQLVGRDGIVLQRLVAMREAVSGRYNGVAHVSDRR
jgi:hypothetical protein